MAKPSGAEAPLPRRPNLYGLDREELATILAPLLTRRFQVSQIYRWIYGRHTTDPAAMTDLPVPLRRSLAGRVVPG